MEEKIINIQKPSEDDLIKAWQVAKNEGVKVVEMTRTSGWKVMEEKMQKFINKVKNGMFSGNEMPRDWAIAKAFEMILAQVKSGIRNYERADKKVKELNKRKLNK